MKPRLQHPGYHRRRTQRLLAEGQRRAMREQFDAASALLGQCTAALPRLVDPAELWGGDDDAAGLADHTQPPRAGVH